MTLLAFSTPRDVREALSLIDMYSGIADAVVIVGGIPSPETLAEHISSLGLEAYAVTGPRDDHYAAESMRRKGFLVEGRLVATSTGLFIAGVNGRDPVTSITQLRERLTGFEGRSIIISYYPPKGCADTVPGIREGAGLYEARELVREAKPLAYITARSPEECVALCGETLVIGVGWLSRGHYVLIDSLGGLITGLKPCN